MEYPTVLVGWYALHIIVVSLYQFNPLTTNDNYGRYPNFILTNTSKHFPSFVAVGGKALC